MNTDSMDNLMGKLFQTFQQAKDSIKDQAANLSESAKEKAQKTIEDWINIIPKLADQGLRLEYFSLEASINPTLTFEMQADVNDFPLERLNELSTRWRSQTPLFLVFSTMKASLAMYQKTNLPLKNPLVVRISVKLAPEIQVSLGEPHQI